MAKIGMMTRSNQLSRRRKRSERKIMQKRRERRMIRKMMKN